MRAASAPRLSAPSTSLLKFLRTQSDTCFFTCNVSPPLPLKHGTIRRTSQNTYTPSLARRISTTSPCQATLQASILNSLWPRSRDVSNPLQNAPYPTATGVQQKRLRHASSQSASLLRRLLRLKEPRPLSNLEPSDLPDHRRPDDTTNPDQLFNLSRSLSRTGTGAETKLRCTEFDANGSVTLVSGEFKKSELIAKYGLLPRDLRKIDSSLLPHILVRKSAILLNLLHLRVLIQADRVLVFDAYGSTDSYTQSLFMYDLEGKLRQKTDARASTYLPYEFRALEAVLISVTSGLESEFEGVREPVVRVLRELEEDIDRDKLRHLLIHSKKLGTFEQKARLVRDAISDLLDADDDLVEMYLTERLQGKEREEDDHQEVEMLLESYHKICDEIVESSGNLISNIRNTEEVVKAILDANRNALMLLEIKFSIGTLGLAAGTLFAGLYGMNLKNFLEDSDVAFSAVTGAAFGFSGLICWYGMKKLGKVQRVRMWGEGSQPTYGQSGMGLSSRGNWKHEAQEHAGRSQAGLVQRRLERFSKAKDAAGGAGRVLWPGMEGLGPAGGDPGMDGATAPDTAPGIPRPPPPVPMTESRSTEGRISSVPVPVKK